jgi:hypothetical protein
MTTASIPGWALAVPFALIGFPALVVGTVMLKRRLVAYRHGEVVEAEVVGLDVHHGPGAVSDSPLEADEWAPTTVTPHFRYWTADGLERTAQLDMQTVQRVQSEGFRLRYKVGDRMQLLVDPARPGIGYAGTPSSLLVFPALLCFSGVLVSLIALGIFFGAES